MIESNHNYRHGKWKSISEMSKILLLSNGNSKNGTETEIPNSISIFYDILNSKILQGSGNAQNS